MTNLEGILKKVQYTESFNDAIECLSADFHAEDFESSSIYEEDDLVFFCETHSTDSIKFRYGSGVSKVVLICTAADGNSYALKTAFAGYAYYPDGENEDEDEDESKDKNEDENEQHFDTYPNANESRVEYLVYQAAREMGLEEFFAETLEISPSVYMQEKYDSTVDSLEKDTCKEYIKPELYERYKEESEFKFNWWKYEEICDFARRVGLKDFFIRLRNNCTSFLLFYSLYSLETLFRLQRFLQDYDINDLHGSNIGFFGDKIKFVDFCGYDSATSEKVGAA